jgi:ABC-type transporter Mla MlaB component
MSSEPMIIVESHRSAATLYASGALTTDGLLRALAQLEQLPSNVRALCVDLRAVRAIEDGAMRTLGVALINWRAVRRGMSRVRLSGAYWLNSGGAWLPAQTP